MTTLPQTPDGRERSSFDVVVAGGGIAGLSAAMSARDAGADGVLLALATR